MSIKRHGLPASDIVGPMEPVDMRRLIIQNCRRSAESLDAKFQILTTASHQWHVVVIKIENGIRTKCLEEKADRLEHAFELLHEASARLVDQYVESHGSTGITKGYTMTASEKITTRDFVRDYGKEVLPLPARKSSAETYSSGSTEYIVKALVGPDGHHVDALPDTGAKRNFVSRQLVDKLGLIPKDRTKEKFRLPSGATIRSCGTVDVPFTFLGESEHHLLDCCILPKCTQDLILCQTFLKVTGTLTKFAHRITKSLRSLAPRFRFNLIEDDTCCMHGSFDNIPSIALADTGCDAMLISADFARRHSLEIDNGVEHRHLVEYADGSLDTTTGIVRDSTWQFRSSRNKIPCDFYVLDDLKADIVLSSHFIFQHEIFSQFEGDIVDMSLIPERDFGDLYNIRLISHYSSALQSLESSSIADMNSPGSFSPGAIKAERVRRDQIRDAIEALPREQQDQARIDERNRQEIWDGYRKRHLKQQEGDTDSTKQVLAVQKQRWWEKGLVWRRFGRRVT